MSVASVEMGWAGKGLGFSAVKCLDQSAIHLNETGRWTSPGGRSFAFTNCYCWTLAGNGIGLEHLRFGPDRPVQLFDFSPAAPAEVSSAAAYACRKDQYTASLTLTQSSILLKKPVEGLKK